MPAVHLALRFHVNLYHSYRGDSLDEVGIGKDIRIIRGILDDLGRLEGLGFPVRAAWDIENHYSLHLYLPRHAPDIIERIRARVASGKDEVEPMSWNNGLLTAHDGGDFEAAVGMAITNGEGSGLADLFPSWAPIARPQECMWNSSQIEGYRKLGIEAVSLYYSAIPFNGFGSFVPALPPEKRHNPLRILDPATGASMRLLPACNPGDLLEHGASLRRWLSSLRKYQLSMVDPVDLLLLLDMDADDSFWEGYVGARTPLVPPSLRGLVPLVRSLRGLGWLRFSLPGDYLRDHPDAGELSLGQDLADGSFDGYSSWAEKEENARLWTVIHEARRKAALAARLGEEARVAPGSAAVAAPGKAAMAAPGKAAMAAPGKAAMAAPGKAAAGELGEVLHEARLARLLALSTTHFGMASPVMNAERLADAFARAGTALEASERALGLASAGRGTGAWYFDPRIDGLARGRGAIGGSASGGFVILDPEGSRAEALEPPGGRPPVEAGAARIASGRLSLACIDGEGVVATLDGKPIFARPLSLPWIRHGGRRREGRLDNVRTMALPGSIASLEVSGRISLPRAGQGGEDVAAAFIHRYSLAGGIEGFRVDIAVDYPRTARRGFDRKKAARLGRDWDARWTEVAPFELEPLIGATVEEPAQVWKHDFTGRLSSYELGYHRFGPNREPDSLDNQVTDSWVAVAGRGRGLLVAQSDEAETLFAFCPLRLRLGKGAQRILLNPFGSYHGRQWRYPSATTGLGRLAALLMADNLDPYAPSWEGGSLRASLFVLPYEGDQPPEGLRRDALVFATRPLWA